MKLTSLPVRAALVALACAVAASCGRAQSVLVVDAAGGAGAAFTEVQPAIQAASDGDTILIRAGRYGSALVVARSVHLIADRGHAVQLDAVLIRDLPAGGAVVLHGVTVQGLGPAVEVVDCAGVVWLEDSTLVGPVQPIVAGPGGHAVLASNASVVVARCAVQGGGPLAAPGIPGSPGLLARASAVHLLDTDITGGDGLSGSSPASHGGAGLSVSGSVVHVQGGSLTGGAGGAAFQSIVCYPAGDGGPGVSIAGAGASAELLDAVVGGGPGGAGAGVCPPGAPGPASVVNGGRLVALAGAAHALRATHAARPGDVLDVDVAGPAGHRVWALFSPGAAPLLGTVWSGPLLVAPTPLVTVPLGQLPASGTLRLSLTVGPLPPQVQVVPLFAQVLALDPSGGVFAGSGQALTVLAARF